MYFVNHFLSKIVLLDYIIYVKNSPLLIFQDDVESIVAQIEMEEKRKQAIVEVATDRPLKRSSFGFVAHPEKDELILFAGEFFNGQKVFYFNYMLPLNKFVLI